MYPPFVKLARVVLSSTNGLKIKEELNKIVKDLKNNKDIEDWNAGKIQVMLAHPASAGHGLNLQAGGSTLIWFSLTWSLELYEQTNARISS